MDSQTEAHRHEDAAVDDVVGQEGVLAAELVGLGEAGGAASAGPVLGLGQRVIRRMVPRHQRLTHHARHCSSNMHTSLRSCLKAIILMDHFDLGRSQPTLM